jgi:hypothetical protein
MLNWEWGKKRVGILLYLTILFTFLDASSEVHGLPPYLHSRPKLRRGHFHTATGNDRC